jgi:hypothetical protein
MKKYKDLNRFEKAIVDAAAKMANLFYKASAPVFSFFCGVFKHYGMQAHYPCCGLVLCHRCGDQKYSEELDGGKIDEVKRNMCLVVHFMQILKAEMKNWHVEKYLESKESE